MRIINHLLLTALIGAFSISLHAAEQQLIIIRHGEAGNNITNTYNSNPDHPDYKAVNLTEAGVLATQKTAKDLIAKGFSNDNIVAVYVSPLPRTVQTADILVQQGLISKDKIILDKRLIDLNTGDLEGKPRFPNWTPDLAKKYHAESDEQLKARIKDFYDALLKKYPNGNIVIISHLIVIQDLMEDASYQLNKLNPGDAKVVPLRGQSIK